MLFRNFLQIDATRNEHFESDSKISIPVWGGGSGPHKNASESMISSTSPVRCNWDCCGLFIWHAPVSTHLYTAQFHPCAPSHQTPFFSSWYLFGLRHALRPGFRLLDCLFVLSRHWSLSLSWFPPLSLSSSWFSPLVSALILFVVLVSVLALGSFRFASFRFGDGQGRGRRRINTS